MPDAKLASYLDGLREELAALPAGRRDEELHEAAEHLAQLVEELHTHGLDDQAAVAAAIERFGPVQRIGRRLRAAHRIRSPWRQFVRATIVNLALVLAFTTAMALVVATTPVPRSFLGSWPAFAIAVVVPLFLTPVVVAAIHELIRQRAEQD